MSKQPPQILSPREPISDGQGNITRSWWRAINGLFENSGSTATPLVVKANAILNDATLTSGGTLSSPDLPARTLIGNSGATSAQPQAITVGTALLFENGSIDLPTIPGGTLMGNAGTVAAVAGAIAIGNNLSLSGGTLDAVAGSSSTTDDETLLYSLRDTRGQAGSLERMVTELYTQVATIRDQRGQIATLERRVGELETALASIRDTRGEVATIGRLINEVKTLSFLRSWGES